MDELPPGLADAVAWYRETGSVPRSGSGPGISGRERRAGNQLTTARWSGRHNAALDAALPGWRDVRIGPRVHGPPDRLVQLAEFVALYQRMPVSNKVADSFERKLYAALMTARRGGYVQHVGWLDGNVPGWRGPSTRQAVESAIDASKTSARWPGALKQ